MKIHYLVTTLETGGAEFAIPDIVTTLQDLGHEVKIYVCEPRDMGAAPRLKAAGLSWCYYQIGGVLFQCLSVLIWQKSFTTNPISSGLR